MPFDLGLILISFENDIDFDYLLDKLVLGYDRGYATLRVRHSPYQAKRVRR